LHTVATLAGNFDLATWMAVQTLLSNHTLSTTCALALDKGHKHVESLWRRRPPLSTLAAEARRGIGGE
jgi:hypothetical protein